MTTFGRVASREDLPSILAVTDEVHVSMMVVRSYE